MRSRNVKKKDAVTRNTDAQSKQRERERQRYVSSPEGMRIDKKARRRRRTNKRSISYYLITINEIKILSEKMFFIVHKGINTW